MQANEQTDKRVAQYSMRLFLDHWAHREMAKGLRLACSEPKCTSYTSLMMMMVILKTMVTMIKTYYVDEDNDEQKGHKLTEF